MKNITIKSIKKSLYRLFFVSVTSVLIMSCGESQPISVAHHPWPGYELIDLYQSLVPESRKHLNIIRTQDSKESIALLESGQVDAAALTMDEALTVREAGTKIKVVLIFDISAGADVVIGNKSISEPHQLVNKRIAYTPGPLSMLILSKLFESSEALGWDNVELQPVSSSEHQSVIEEGKAEAVVTYPPASRQLILDNKNILFDSSEMPNLIFDVLAVRESSLNFSNRNNIRNLINAHFEGRQHFISNPQDASFRLSQKFGLAAQEVINTYRGLLLPDSRENHRLLGGDSPQIERYATEIVEVLSSHGLISPTVSTAELFTDQYLPTELNH
jgi:NitT/TauT family transport system substrate-binding protein